MAESNISCRLHPWPRKWMCLGVMFHAMICACLSGEPDSLQILMGKAYHVKTGKYVYRVERHFSLYQGEVVQELSVFYDTRGNRLAEKTYDFTRNRYRPEITINRFYKDSRLQLHMKGKTAHILKQEKGETTTQKVKLKPGVIYEGGFGKYLRDNFARFSRGEKVTFPFFIPSMGNVFDFEVSPRPESNSDTLVLEMELQNWVVRMMVDPIILVYDIKSKTILEYKGVVDIPDAKGKRQAVHIYYTEPGPAAGQ